MVRHKLTNGIYEAEFFFDSKTANVHWVVCLLEGIEIVMWGVSSSLELAEGDAMQEMQSLNRRSAARA